MKDLLEGPTFDASSTENRLVDVIRLPNVDIAASMLSTTLFLSYNNSINWENKLHVISCVTPFKHFMLQAYQRSVVKKCGNCFV